MSKTIIVLLDSHSLHSHKWAKQLKQSQAVNEALRTQIEVSKIKMQDTEKYIACHGEFTQISIGSANDQWSTKRASCRLELNNQFEKEKDTQQEQTENDCHTEREKENQEIIQSLKGDGTVNNNNINNNNSDLYSAFQGTQGHFTNTHTHTQKDKQTTTKKNHSQRPKASVNT